MAWLAGRPKWQRNVATRICQGENLGPEDIREIAAKLVEGQATEPSALTEADIPGGSFSPDPVRLTQLRNVEGINVLAADQTLTFAERGVTVVYGDNGSGKSGYARLVRTAVRARVHGDVLGNVFEAAPRGDQHAVFEYTVGRGAQTSEWKWKEPFSNELGRIQFYDDECGRAYISTASEISYRPSALTLLDQLVSVCDSVRQVLDDQLQTNTNSRAAIPTIDPHTEAGKFLASLSSKTTSEQIATATARDEADGPALAAALQHEAQLKGSDPLKEQKRLTALSEDYKSLASHCGSIDSQLEPAAMNHLVEIRRHARDLRAAAKIASEQEFSNEPLNGVGSQTWRKLWETAKAFSESEAYPDHDFPHTGPTGHCVLCQQALSSEGAARLSRFQKFMTDTTENDAQEAENRLATVRVKLAAMQTVPPLVTASMARIRSESEVDANAVEEWLQDAGLHAAKVTAWLDETTMHKAPSEVSESPSKSLASTATTLTDRARDLDSAAFKDQLAAAVSAVQELQAKIALGTSAGEITKEVKRLAGRATIEAAKRMTDTGVITRKSTELTKEHVTRVVRDQFTRETEGLKLRRVTLDSKAGRKSSLQHLPSLLDAATRASVTEVLSEGEKTALGLAGFFTEVEFDESLSSVVLDDPITSLDHTRRSLVARRIVELAENRQVIVFTHDVIFVGDLVKHGAESKVPISERWISRRGNVAGYCAEQHPWKAKDVKKRISDLKVELGRITRVADDLDPEAYDEKCASWAGKLSETWERAVNMEIVYEVVDRGTSQVKPHKFRILAAITNQDNEDFQIGYGRTSEWARRHDKDPEVNFVAPSCDEMAKEMNRIDTWYHRIKAYRQ
ncbi:AAA family ATPase [Burkholderia sp. RS01]|uniref:AAA family ATPase n=1 Tax=unclassified Burkholderia TaxID=2613784 RepID=UPI003218A003